MLSVLNPFAYFQGVEHNGGLDPAKWNWDEAYYKFGTEIDSDGNWQMWFGYGWDPNLVAGGGYDSQDGAVAGIIDPDFARLQSPVPGTSAEEITDGGIDAAREVYGDDPWIGANESERRVTQAIGSSNDFTLAAGPLGFSIESGTFTYKGDSYEFMTLGYAMGAEFSLATNVFNIKDYNGSFKPQDFGGHSVTNNFSLIFTYARESAYMNIPAPYNYGYKSNLVGYGSLGFSAGYFIRIYDFRICNGCRIPPGAQLH